MKKYYVVDANVDWDLLPEYKCLPDLPNVFSEQVVYADNEEDMKDILVDNLTEEYNFLIEHLEYKIIAIGFVLNKEDVLKYIEDNYQEDDEDREWLLGHTDERWTLEFWTGNKVGALPCKLIYKDDRIHDELVKEYAERLFNITF